MVTSIELKSYRTDEGVKVAFIKTGAPKWMPVLVMDGPLRVRKVPTEEQRYMTDLTKKGKPYPVKTAVRLFRRFGKAHGISKGAKQFLKEASQLEVTS